MFTRETIVDTLARQLEALQTRFRAFTPEELERPCTKSEAENGTSWRPLDHITHLAMIERAFQGMAVRTIEGDPHPVGFGNISREDILARIQKNAPAEHEEQDQVFITLFARIHRNNQKVVDRHASDDLEMRLADLTAARADTLALVARLSDEQLASPLPGAPWSDGTIGGVLLTNAHHQIQHLGWIEEGLLKGWV